MSKYLDETGLSYYTGKVKSSIAEKQDLLASKNAGDNVTIDIAAGHSLPERYQEVEYIKGNGTQYLDINHYPTEKTDVEVRVAQPYDTISEWRFIIGGQNENVYKSYILGYLITTSYLTSIRSTYQKCAVRYEGYKDTDISSNFNVFRVWKTQGKYLYIDDILVSTLPDYVESRTFTSDYTMYLFAGNRANSPAGISPVTISYCKVFEAGQLAMHLIPCYDKQDNNKAGMYDLVNDVFYSNANTSATEDFEIGNKVSNYPIINATVNNSTIGIYQGGVKKGEFTLNQDTDLNISLDAGGEEVPLTGGNGITINPLKQIGINQSDFRFTNVNLYGNLTTATSPVLNGFDYNDYASPIPSQFGHAIANSTNWEVVFKFTYQPTESRYNYVQSLFAQSHVGWENKFCIGNNGVIGFTLTSTNSSYNISDGFGTTTLSVGGTYYAKYTFDGTHYKAFLSSDGLEWSEEVSVESSLKIKDTTEDWVIGINRYGSGSQYNYPFKGNIDLSGCYIKIDGNEWWKANWAGGQIAKATSENYGLMRLHQEVGADEEGTMSQNAIATLVAPKDGNGVSIGENSVINLNQEEATGNYITIGNPTIDGNFKLTAPTHLNYVKSGNYTSLNEFKVLTKVTYNNSNQSQILVFDETVQLLRTENHKLGIWFPGSSVTTGTSTLSNGTTYWVMGILENNTYKIYHIEDNNYTVDTLPELTSWTLDITNTNTTFISYLKATTHILMGVNLDASYTSEHWYGSIYLADTFVKKVDDTNYYSFVLGGIVAKATSSLYGLVKPDNETITVNNGVISAEIIDDTSTTSLTKTWSASKLDSIISQLEQRLSRLEQ